MKPYLSIIIPTKDRLKILETTVKDLISSLSDQNYEIIVVNDSKNHSFDLENVKVIENPKSGAASARNFGVLNSTGDYLLFIDDDMIVNSEAINEVINCTVRDQKVIYMPNWEYPEEIQAKLDQYPFGRFLKKINYTSLKGWISTQLNWDSVNVYEHNAVASFCYCISRENFNELGGYNEKIPHAGFEDYDLSERLKKIGFKFRILTTKMIIHNETDRIELTDFLNRRKRNGITQKKAVEIGYTESKLTYSWRKKIIFSFIKFNEKPILWTCTHFPNIKKLDWMYAKIISILIAYNIYLGYQRNSNT